MNENVLPFQKKSFWAGRMPDTIQTQGHNNSTKSAKAKSDFLYIYASDKKMIECIVK